MIPSTSTFQPASSLGNTCQGWKRQGLESRAVAMATVKSGGRAPLRTPCRPQDSLSSDCEPSGLYIKPSKPRQGRNARSKLPAPALPLSSGPPERRAARFAFSSLFPSSHFYQGSRRPSGPSPQAALGRCILSSLSTIHHFPEKFSRSNYPDRPGTSVKIRIPRPHP